LARLGKALAYGAATIVNAISCGLGAALGVGLWTEATVGLTDEPGVVEGKIISDPTENTELITKTARRVLKYLSLENEYGASVETRSNIPIARGLKSSSVAANAVALATFEAAGKSADDLTVVNLAVDAGLDANVTVTGAFDDACASYFGNLVVTDNRSRKIIQRFDVKEKVNVLILVPARKEYTATSNVERMRMVSREVEAIHGMALAGEYWVAMTLNGLVYSAVLGYDQKAILDAIASGALAAGLSGKGPAVTAIVSEENTEKVMKRWRRYDGEIIQTNVNKREAHVLR
jgi:shikimate kinase